MKKRNLLFVALLGLAITLTMCKKDDDPPYLGTWESAVFQDPTSGISSKMTFDFEKTSFLAKISIMVGANTFLDLLGIKGSFVEKANQTLEVSLTDIGEWDAGLNDYNWKNRETDAVYFTGLYNGYLSTSMPLDFDAIYKVDGDKLDLIVPLANDTIHLYRK